MNKRMILATIAVFAVWSVLDFIIHGTLLKPAYEATAHLWRPMQEMSVAVIQGVTFFYVALFVMIYGLLITQKSPAMGIKFGLLFGLASGISMGFGSYAYMPIPLDLALSWFFSSLFEAVVAGVIVGVLVRD